MLTVISALLAAVIGSFLAFVLTYCKERKQQRNRLRVACRILFHAVNRHYYWLTHCSGRDLRFWLCTQEDFSDWQTLKYELGDLTLDEFDVIFEHFKKMQALRTVGEQSPNLVNFLPESIKEAVNLSSKAHKLLYWYAYRDAPEKLHQYYKDADPGKSPCAANKK